MPSTRPLRRLRWFGPVLGLLLALTAEPAGALSSGPPGFVQRDGARLVLDGAPYVFTGLNIYNAATSTGTCWYPMTGDGVLDATLRAIGPGNEVFRAWFFQAMATTDGAGVVKSVDKNHLLSLGSIGSGQCGMRAEEYRTVHAVGGIDLCEYHDYDHATEPVPGDEWNGYAVRLRQCQELGKPLFTGELGLRPGEADGTFAGRAAQLDAKVRGQLGAGGVGVLVWTWRNVENGGSAPDDFFVGPGDPALAVLRSY